MGKKVLGLDYGCVLFNPFTGQPLPGMFESLKKVVDSGIFSEVWIISKATPLFSLISLFWLWRSRFWEKTGIPRRSIRYVWRTMDKAEVCLELGVTHFVDDRLEVLKYMARIVKCRVAFRPSFSSITRNIDTYDYVPTVQSWNELVPILLKPGD